ncbi:MAG: 4Fe-4S dicluster domain-containing protein [Fermentimonas sp.]|jgi:ferredoxin
MLKKIRVALSILLFSLITLYFLDFRGFLPRGLQWLTEIQFVPALLALNVAVLIGLLLLTLLFGRVYCSFICPMGVYQDMVAWISRRVNKKKRYRYHKAKNGLRVIVLASTVVAFILGFTLLVGLLDPYGAYGRMVTHLLRPAYLAGNNLLASIFTSFNNFTFYKVSVYIVSVSSLVIALITLLGIGYMTWRGGRSYCNTVCPVGTILGFLSRYSLFKVRIDEVKCNACGLCAMKCKASCIDAKNKRVDYSRCVTCFNCLGNCHRGAMEYKLIVPWKRNKQLKVEESQKTKPLNEKSRSNNAEELLVQLTNCVTGQPVIVNNQEPTSSLDASKRRFLTALLAISLPAKELMAKTGSEKLLSKRTFKRQTPIAPPGVPSIDHLLQKCISCHLCVSKCPSRVIKPALLEYGLEGMMQPMLYFERGFCNYDCTVCGDVCPTGAILPLTKEEKNHTQMGQVQLILENCIVCHDETSCGACSEHCPTQAVRMIPYKGILTIPEINPDICVGCGGCEYVCPAIPFKAIHVEGLTTQRRIEIEHDEVKEIQINDFGF